MNSSDLGIDISQFVAIASILGFALKVFMDSRKVRADMMVRTEKEKERAVKDALWKQETEHKINLLKTQGCKDTDQLESVLKDFRREVKEDHVETKREIADMRTHLEQRIDAVEVAGRQGRNDIYNLIEKLRK